VSRVAEIARKTLETDIRLTLELDGSGKADVRTGIPFLDHLLTALVRHARFDLTLECVGDLEVGDHHTVEDCGLAIGTAIDEALGERRGIARFGSAFAPMDEALARAAVDISGRPASFVALRLTRETLGTLSCENIPHLLTSLAAAAKMTLHVDVLRSENDHHRAESAFKAVALALRQAVREDGSGEIPSSKGAL
jgi:imidazoleglycerol-phosphate dehydratase